MMDARRPRALFAALAMVALTLGAIPIASPAASTTSAVKSASAKKAAAAKTTAKTAKTVAKKTVKKPVGYHPKNGPAPADEYFGRLQMSILGVRNKVKDLGLDAELHPEHGKAVLGNALWVEDAMRDWAKKYPFDRWLPRYAYALEQMYERIPGDDAHRRAVKQVSYLTAYFPQTLYGKVGRAKLVAGIPVADPSEPPAGLTELERLALLDGKVLPTIPPAATPTPSASPSPATVPASIESPAPSASFEPSAATPAPTASARP
ncbi:MAG: hypothetical protein QOJ39_1747 [Candidatus Eremiobacteraeota bacterium]|jgi:hypothetical protein|nr:hypothetical protein [Candidatus Eremiobacteraeota bacterium]